MAFSRLCSCWSRPCTSATPLLAALFSYLALSKLAFWGKKWIGLTLFCCRARLRVYRRWCSSSRRALSCFPEIVSTAIPIVVRWAEQYGAELPFTDVESLRTMALDSVRDTLGHIGKYLKIATKESVLFVIGIVVAVGIFINPDFEPKRRRGKGRANLYTYYTGRIRERFASFYRSFEIVMGAQIIISAINTAATAVFIYLRRPAIRTHRRDADVRLRPAPGCRQPDQQHDHHLSRVYDFTQACRLRADVSHHRSTSSSIS